MKKILFILLFCCVNTIVLRSQLRISAESGLVFTQYNDVRAPNGDQNQGTLFSFSDDFEEQNQTAFFRLELAYLINNRHTIELTAAPLTVEYNNSTLSIIDFEDTLFEGENINGRYEFNTYRASYRYRLVDRERWLFDLGASLLVRDARIALTQGTIEEDNTDLGFVPLVSFELQYLPTDRLSLLLKGDALVGPQGRAEDIFAGALFDLYQDSLQLKAGYRVIEGGADVDQVYNFAFFHFASLGLVWIL